MKIRIIGLGNVLMSDDGFGPYVVRVLEAFYDLPQQVQVIDAGTPGVDLTPYLLDADTVIFVDTVNAAGRVGDIHEFGFSDIVGQGRGGGPHDPAVKEALLTVAAAGMGPKNVMLVGVIPEWIATGVSLSPPVRSAIAPVIGVLATELERLGVRVSLRPTPRHADTWWMRPTSEDVSHAVA
jgi:hydrogenase maturation protease